MLKAFDWRALIHEIVNLMLALLLVVPAGFLAELFDQSGLPALNYVTAGAAFLILCVLLYRRTRTWVARNAERYVTYQGYEPLFASIPAIFMIVQYGIMLYRGYRDPPDIDLWIILYCGGAANALIVSCLWKVKTIRDSVPTSTPLS